MDSFGQEGIVASKRNVRSHAHESAHLAENEKAKQDQVQSAQAREGLDL